MKTSHTTHFELLYDGLPVSRHETLSEATLQRLKLAEDGKDELFSIDCVQTTETRTQMSNRLQESIIAFECDTFEDLWAELTANPWDFADNKEEYQSLVMELEAFLFGKQVTDWNFGERESSE